MRSEGCAFPRCRRVATLVNVRSWKTTAPSLARQILPEDADRMLNALDAIEESSEDLLVPPLDGRPWMVQP